MATRLNNPILRSAQGGASPFAAMVPSRSTTAIREVLGAHKQLGAHSSLNGGAQLGT